MVNGENLKNGKRRDAPGPTTSLRLAVSVAGVGVVRDGALVHQADEHGVLEAGAEPRVLQSRLRVLDDVPRGVVCLTGGARRAAFRMELAQGHVGHPQLSRVADVLGDGERLAKGVAGVVP